MSPQATALRPLQRKLEKLELEHLREFITQQATTIDDLRAQLETADNNGEYWRESWFNLSDVVSKETGAAIGMTKDGEIGLVATQQEQPPCAVGDHCEEIGMTIDGQVGLIAKPFSLDVPLLAEGETYVATLFDAEEHKGYHLILLPGDNDAAPWEKQTAWAKRIGGELPTRVEQSLLFAKLKSSFKEAAYWSGTESSDSGSAWYQGFYDGYQYGLRKTNELRARAVRRLPI